MTSEEVKAYISVRNGELSNDEIKYITDTDRNPTLNHIICENSLWQMWDCDGNYYEFKKRTWN